MAGKGSLFVVLVVSLVVGGVWGQAAKKKATAAASPEKGTASAVNRRNRICSLKTPMRKVGRSQRRILRRAVRRRRRSSKVDRPHRPVHKEQREVAVKNEIRSATSRFRGPTMPAGPSGMTSMRYMLPLPPANPVLQNRKTGWLYKLVDYVVGDGPASRFALICRYCATHNGLATPEDFPFTSYRCVYCRQFNPSKEQRPSAATLPRNTVLIEEMESTLKSEGEESTVEEDGDGEKPAADEDKTKEEEGGETGREKGDGENPEPRVELAGSTSDLSSRKSAAGESDNEDRDKLAEAIPFADDEEAEEDSVETMGDNVEEVEEDSKTEIGGIGTVPVVPTESEVESSEGIGIASS